MGYYIKGLLLRQSTSILLSLLLSIALYAEKVEITAKQMRAENIKKEIHFMGEVSIKQAQDWLKAQEVIVYFDENNQTKRYEALGSVTFEFKNVEHHYVGHANSATFQTQKSLYILQGDAMIDDKINESHLNGEEILLNMKSGKASVKSSKQKPVKFIIEMDKK